MGEITRTWRMGSDDGIGRFSTSSRTNGVRHSISTSLDLSEVFSGACISSSSSFSMFRQSKMSFLGVTFPLQFSPPTGLLSCQRSSLIQSADASSSSSTRTVARRVAERQVELLDTKTETLVDQWHWKRTCWSENELRRGPPGKIGPMMKMSDAKRHSQGKKEIVWRMCCDDVLLFSFLSTKKQWTKESSEGEKTTSSIFLDIDENVVLICSHPFPRLSSEKTFR